MEKYKKEVHQMKTVYINNLGYLQSPSVPIAEIELIISDEEATKISFQPLGKLWQYDEKQQAFKLVNGFDESEFRLLRDDQCFSIINRSPLWYNSLTDQQRTELQDWYQAWLDVTETKQIPEKPDWL